MQVGLARYLDTNANERLLHAVFAGQGPGLGQESEQGLGAGEEQTNGSSSSSPSMGCVDFVGWLRASALDDLDRCVEEDEGEEEEHREGEGEGQGGEMVRLEGTGDEKDERMMIESNSVTSDADGDTNVGRGGDGVAMMVKDDVIAQQEDTIISAAEIEGSDISMKEGVSMPESTTIAGDVSTPEDVAMAEGSMMEDDEGRPGHLGVDSTQPMDMDRHEVEGMVGMDAHISNEEEGGGEREEGETREEEQRGEADEEGEEEQEDEEEAYGGDDFDED